MTTTEDREFQFTERLIATANRATAVGLPVDAAARALLGAAMSVMLRHLAPAALANELRVLADRLDDMPEEVATHEVH